MIDINYELRNKIKNAIEIENFFLYHIDQEQVGQQQHLIIYINKKDFDSTISLDDCVFITQKINEFIDEYIDEEYVLEISSSGINRRLYTKEHFQEAIGAKIKIHLKSKVEGLESKKVEGILDSLQEEGIMIDDIYVNFEKIKKAFYIGGKND